MRLFILLFLTLTATAQRPPDMPVSAEQRARIVEAVAENIEKHYVEVEKGREIAATLRAATFDAKTALDLVPAVNKVLGAAGGDKHLRFGYSHEPQTDAPDDPVAVRREVAQNGFGIHGVQRLEGNVGLLTWNKFHDPSIAGDAVAAAMKLLSSTDAVIVDLRNSDGGSPQMVSLLLTYFVPEGDPRLISTVENRHIGMNQQYWTLAYVPGPRLAGKPLYVLTSKRTWSAGEGFAAHARRLVKATIVGETTRGGARMSRWITVHPHFAVSVSVARHVGIDWEGVGIKPDVEVPEADALAAALKLNQSRAAPSNP
jgi:Peptidase family S41